VSSEAERVAIITGAARGIGLAIAERLTSEGGAVCITDLDIEPAEQAAQQLRSAGANVLALGGDVASHTDCERWVAETVERFGALHILVNNAGLTRDAMVHRMTEQQWRGVQEVVLGGAFHMIQAVAPHFRDRERTAARRIVNIASVSGIYGSTGNANYASAKAGLIGLTRTIAKEWAQFGVTANAVAPGFIATRMTAARAEGQPLGMPAEVREAIVRRIPVGRAGEPADVAAAVAFFCGEDAGFITGQVLEVHGGLPEIAVTG
jgi:3-oxoacyl-[acyl-carrier protein] reductase